MLSMVPHKLSDSSGVNLNFDGIWYKIAGFVISWVEKTPLVGQGQAYSVRTASFIRKYVSEY